MEQFLPSIGLGTPIDHDTCRRAVTTALDVGYRFVDTAQMYDNERAVGEGLRESSVDREEVLIASKLAPENLEPEDVRSTTRESLDRLGLDRLDLLYVHWPTDTYNPERTLPALDDLRESGLVDEIGVSNFSPALLAEARSILDAPIVANQIECHPLCPQAELRADAAEHGYQLVAYSPLGRGELLGHDALAPIAAEFEVSVPELVLGWLAAKNVVPIPKSSSREHIQSNLDAVAASLPDAAIARLDAVEDRYRTVDPDYAFWNDGAP